MDHIMPEERQCENTPQKMAYPTVKQAWGILGLFFLITLGYAMPIGMLTVIGLEVQKGPFLLLNYTIPLVALIFVTQIWWKKNPGNQKAIYFKAFPVLVLPIAIVVTFALGIIINEITSWMPMPEVLQQLFKDMVEPNIWGFLTVTIAAAFLEEILFRGIVLEGMLRNYSPWKAILWSSLFFGIFHLNPWQFVAGFLIGTAIGYLYWKTRSVWVGIIIHFINNATAYVLYLKYPDANGLPELFGLGWTDRIILFVVTALIIWLCYRFLESHIKAKKVAVE